MRDLKVSEVMNIVEKAVPYTPENYVELGKRLDADPNHREHQRMAFAFGHALLHQTKSSAVIASALEKFEHGDMNAFMSAKFPIKEAIIKLFGNAARLFEVAGMTPHDVAELLESEFPPR